MVNAVCAGMVSLMNRRYTSSIMKTRSHDYFVQMPALLIVLSLVFAVGPSRLSGGTRDRDPGITGETLVPLRTGTASPFSYGLYNLKSYGTAASSAPPGNHLVLVL